MKIIWYTRETLTPHAYRACIKNPVGSLRDTTALVQSESRDPRPTRDPSQKGLGSGYLSFPERTGGSAEKPMCIDTTTYTETVLCVNQIINLFHAHV